MKHLLIILLLSFSLAGYFEEHIYAGKVAHDITEQLVSVNPVIDKLAQYTAMSISHVVVDRLIGEHWQGEYSYDSTIVGTLTMFFATPREERFEFIENFVFSCLIPDILFKQAFHDHNLKPIIQLSKDQSVLVSKISVLFFCVRVDL